jgi:hypothetical protein
MHMLLHARILFSVAFPLIATLILPADEKSDAQEMAVAAIKKMGGRVETDSKAPGEPVVKVHLFGGKIAGTGLECLKALPAVYWVGLHKSDITNADVKHLKSLPKLRRLGLAETKITDAALIDLKEITTLEWLQLYDCAITDEGLAHLKTLKKLKHLDISGTKVTKEGIKELQDAIPEVTIYHPLKPLENQ